MEIEEIQNRVVARKALIAKSFAKFNSSHEGIATIKLYADKLWKIIQALHFAGITDPGQVRDVAQSIGAATIIFLESICSVDNGLELALAELKSAEDKFAPFNSTLEGYAVLLEEIDELWDVVKLNPKKIEAPADITDVEAWQIEQRNKMLLIEAVQVTAMSLRFMKCVKEEPAVTA